MFAPETDNSIERYYSVHDLLDREIYHNGLFPGEDRIIDFMNPGSEDVGNMIQNAC
jgi:hypothetical protein